MDVTRPMTWDELVRENARLQSALTTARAQIEGLEAEVARLSTVTDAAVERVARALCKVDGWHPDEKSGSAGIQPNWKAYTSSARAALAAFVEGKS